MKFMLSASALAAIALMSAAPMAQDRDFTMVNNTGYAIKGIYVNLPGDNVFNENELSSPLENGGKFLVKFTRADGGTKCVWNIKVDWTDGSAPSFFNGLNLCQLNTVYLKYDKQKDVTSYTTD
ncbi:MAG: hypothetical protein ISP45_29555 [Reyranella sp.]|nr:hypothetical protein [Reyranella sp.]